MASCHTQLIGSNAMEIAWDRHEIPSNAWSSNSLVSWKKGQCGIGTDERITTYPSGLQMCQTKRENLSKEPFTIL